MSVHFVRVSKDQFENFLFHEKFEYKDKLIKMGYEGVISLSRAGVQGFESPSSLKIFEVRQ